MLPISQGPNGAIGSDTPAHNTRSKARLGREGQVNHVAVPLVLRELSTQTRKTRHYDRIVGNIQYGCYKVFAGLSTACVYSVFPAFIAAYYLQQAANYFEAHAKAHFALRV